MAHLTQPHARGTPHLALVAANSVIDAIGDIECRLLAFEAVEQLLSPQKANCTEDLAHVDRVSLGWLVTVLNVDLRKQVVAAQAAAEHAAQAAIAVVQGGVQ